MAPSSEGDLGVRGFASGSETYERARPDYPPALIEELARTAGPGSGIRVADLAAGTGKLTRLLGPAAVGIEPSADMRSVFLRTAPGVPLVGGTAEAIPLAEASCDLVTVAQAFHWFDPRVALAEMARVLRPGGSIALVWNERDEREQWAAELGRIMHAGHAPHPRAQDYVAVVDRSGCFGPVRWLRIPYRHRTDRSGLVGMVASRSYVNVLPPPERAALLARVAALAEGLPEPLAVPYVTEVLLARTTDNDGATRPKETPGWSD